MKDKKKSNLQKAEEFELRVTYLSSQIPPKKCFLYAQSKLIKQFSAIKLFSKKK